MHYLQADSAWEKLKVFLHMGFLSRVPLRLQVLASPTSQGLANAVPSSFQQHGPYILQSYIQPVSYHDSYRTSVIYCFLLKMWGSHVIFMKTTPRVYLYCIFRDVVLIERELANLRCKQWLAFALTHVVNITDLSCWVMWKGERLVVDYWTAQHRAHLACQMRGYSNELALLPIT